MSTKNAIDLNALLAKLSDSGVDLTQLATALGTKSAAKPGFTAEVIPGNDRIPNPLVSIAGDGFKAKYLSPRLLLAVLEHVKEVRAACDQAIADTPTKRAKS